MCGIAGFLQTATRPRDWLESTAERMGDAIRHRGPDAGDVWVDEQAGIALSHRRLSIIDLSAAGAQPMISADGSRVIIYNGEVYNFAEIRTRLESRGVRFRGHSDTEVILAACVEWGVTKTVESLIGMFAFALWNRTDRTLTLARDRLGIKPLYWSLRDGAFLFGSELKAMAQHPACPRAVNRTALTDYLRFGFLAGTDSIYDGIHRLPPGHLLTYRVGAEPDITSFWTVEDVVRRGAASPFTGDDGEATDALESLVDDAVSRRMVADVPLGAFLSGGVDSSLVVAMMQRRNATPVKTFSIGFREDAYNEAPFARAVADHLGTEHTELYVTPEDAQTVIPRLPDIFDEPFGDPSQIPTYLVSALTRQHVTVSLSGDGGDELFAGYGRYFKGNQYKSLFLQPRWLMRLEASAIGMLSPRQMNSMGRVLPRRLRTLMSGDKLYRLPSILRDGHPAELYRSLLSHADDPASIVLGGRENPPASWAFAREFPFRDSFAYMQYLDSCNYLPDDILTKVDRASMAVSLEARVPLIDHRIVEFSWTLPQSMKVRDGQGKWLLRELLYRHVPRELIDRPKKGFGVPIGQWLRTSLRDWAEDLLSEQSLADGGLLNVAHVRQKWTEHLQGRVNWEYHLWDLLMLQAWVRRYRPSVS